MDWIGISLVAAISLVIGFVAANLINNLRSDEKPVPPVMVPEVDGRVEVLRLLRPAQGGAVQPEVDGETLLSAGSLTAEQHARISMALVDLYAWLEGGDQPIPKLEKPLPPQKPAPESEGKESSVPVKPPSLNVFKALARTAQSEVTQKVETAPLSLAAEIDEILQLKLEDSPLAGKGIRLMDLPKQGMVIMIGLEKYTDVESVPDEGIKSLLREAVAEWEMRAKGDSHPA